MNSLLRWLRLPAGLLAASVLLMACTDEGPADPTPAPTVTSPAIPESTGTPAPIVSPTPPVAAPGERRTGSPELDAMNRPGFDGGSGY